MRKRVIQSTVQDPYYNMSYEAKLFEELADDEVILFLYVNSPCVVIGRHQNPWQEVHIDHLSKRETLLVRRQSGGGTVYQDLNNLNFSFIYKRGQRTVDENFAVLIEACSAFGIQLEVTSRKDLMVGNKKVSGNAFYQKGRSYMHHGTLLVDVDLSELWYYLRFDDDILQGKPIRSKKSPVVNLKELNDKIETAELAFRIAKCFNADIMTYTSNKRKDELDNLRLWFSSWEWLFGLTPPFRYMHEGKIIHVRKGMIEHIEGQGSFDHLINQTFDENVVKKEV